MHEAQVEGQSAEGAYLQCTATTPFETVCKQFVNGSVPFGFSLNSGFDTGNDSWFSRGCLSGRRGGREGGGGTPVQKHTPGALRAGESERASEREGLTGQRPPLPVGSGTQRSQKKQKQKNSLCRRKRGRRVERLESILVLTSSHCRPPGASNRLPSSGREDMEYNFTTFKLSVLFTGKYFLVYI